MKRYENLFNYVLNQMSARYDIDDELLKVKLIKYLAYYISKHEVKDDYIISLADNIFFNLIDNSEPRKIFKKIKVIGLGGVSGNFLIYILSKSIYFDDIIFFEDYNEKVELSNAIRYLVFNPYEHISKIDFFKKLCFLFGRNDIKFVEKKYTSCSDDNYIIFGTPDLSTRAEIVKHNLKYIFLFHQDDNFYIFTNLSKKFNKYVVSETPLVESYGRIKLSTFLSELIRNIKIVLEVIENAN